LYEQLSGIYSVLLSDPRWDIKIILAYKFFTAAFNNFCSMFIYIYIYIYINTSVYASIFSYIYIYIYIYIYPLHVKFIYVLVKLLPFGCRH
jgi:hypothetical protein